MAARCTGPGKSAEYLGRNRPSPAAARYRRLFTSLRRRRLAEREQRHYHRAQENPGNPKRSSHVLVSLCNRRFREPQRALSGIGAFRFAAWDSSAERTATSQLARICAIISLTGASSHPVRSAPMISRCCRKARAKAPVVGNTFANSPAPECGIYRSPAPEAHSPTAARSNDAVPGRKPRPHPGRSDHWDRQRRRRQAFRGAKNPRR